MKYSMTTIANRILDQITDLLIEIDDINPECISKLTMKCDLMQCFEFSALQIRLLKYALKMKFNLPFNYIDVHSKEIKVNRLITYIIVYSEDKMLYEWHDSLRVA